VLTFTELHHIAYNYVLLINAFYLNKSTSLELASTGSPEIRHLLPWSLILDPIFGNASARNSLGKAPLASHASATAASLHLHILAPAAAPTTAPESSTAALVPPVLDNVVCKTRGREIIRGFREKHSKEKGLECKHPASVRVLCPLRGEKRFAHSPKAMETNRSAPLIFRMGI